DSIYYVKPLLHYSLPYHRIIQLGALGILALSLILNYKKYDNWRFRVQALGILMGWTILFSEAAEKHTYIIALAGYLLWYWSRQTHTTLDKVLYWLAFFLLCVVPVDLFVP